MSLQYSAGGKTTVVCDACSKIVTDDNDVILQGEWAYRDNVIICPSCANDWPTYRKYLIKPNPSL